jgi:hypothetical protein
VADRAIRRSPGLTWRLVLPLLMGVASIAPVTTVDRANGASPTLPVLATGQITFPVGATSGQVMAFAMPSPETMTADSPGDQLAEPLIASADVGNDGTFTLRADPAEVPAANKSDGIINVQAVAVSGGEQQSFFFPATLAGTTTAAKTFVSTTTSRKPKTANLRFNMRGGSATNTRYSPTKWTGPNGHHVAASKAAGTNTTMRVTPKLQSIATAVSDDDTATTDATTCIVFAGDKYPAKPEHFMNAYTDNNGTASVHVAEGSSSHHTLGLAVLQSNGSWAASGSDSISRSSDTSAVSADRQHSWAYWNKVNYQQFTLSCTGHTWRGPIGFYDILAGDLDGQVDMLWLVNSCGVKLKGDTWDTGSATSTTFGTGVDIGPVSLSAQSGFGTSENIHYTFLKKGEMAGNSGLGPVQSSKVEADEFWQNCQS